MSKNSENIVTKIDDAFHSNGQPLGEGTPDVPFAVVSLSYLAVLLLGTAVVGIYVWLI